MSRARPGWSRTELAPSASHMMSGTGVVSEGAKSLMSSSSYLGSGQSGARGHLVKDWPGVREKLTATPVHVQSDWAVTIR